MTANVILNELLQFTDRVLQSLPVTRQDFTLRLRNGKTYQAKLPVNPYGKRDTPIILVPSDILRDLPMAKDWSEVADAAAKNEELRSRVNDNIAALWKAKTLKEKDELKRWALSGKEEFQTFLDMVRSAEQKPYDIKGDPRGEIFWRKLAVTLAQEEPLTLKAPAQLDLEGVVAVVEQIIEQFRFLIEDRRYSEELYSAGLPRPEKAAQRLFFAIA